MLAGNEQLESYLGKVSPGCDRLPAWVGQGAIARFCAPNFEAGLDASLAEGRVGQKMTASSLLEETWLGREIKALAVGRKRRGTRNENWAGVGCGKRS